MTEPVRVKRIEVKGLFGLYDHTIEMKLQDRVTILHGPNGIGKTALLRMVRAALAGDAISLAEKPFERFLVERSDGTALEITPARGETKARAWPPPLVRFELHKQGSSQNVAVRCREGGPQRLAGPLAKALGDFVDMENRPKWLLDLAATIPIRVVDTHRLLVDNDRSNVTVEWIARDLVKRLSDTLTSYANETQEQSRSFLQRVLRSNGEKPDVEDLRRRIGAVQGALERLSTLGLLQSTREAVTAPLTDLELQSADATKLSMMAQYVADQERAIGAFRELSDRVGLFEKALAAKLQDKSVRLSQTEGLVAVNRLGKQIPLASLSSGEQHEIVIFYELLFLSPKGTLVLIDEPEISMHLLWQKQLVADILEIAKLVELDVLLATHSPYIVDERTDLLVPLTAEAA